ncbi:MAG: hexitol phosphatase HxpB [Bacteroidetes bacterium]|nr:hexitol phosphatase HxpB [Bacteroidota bacterium]
MLREKYKAIIFDMDGVLIDSEPLWRKAMIEIFNSVGLPFDDDKCIMTTGLRIDEVTQHWYDMHPWPHYSPDEVAEKIIDQLIQLIELQGKSMKGTMELLYYLQQQNYKLAIATSSSMRIVEAVITTLKLNSFFNIIHSAEHEDYGKPHPAVFISTAKKLNCTPGECLVIEDSGNGIIAAKAARMQVVAVPEPHLANHPAMLLAKGIYPSLTEVWHDFISGKL